MSLYLCSSADGEDSSELDGYVPFLARVSFGSCFCSLSAHSFPCTPLCPGTHRILAGFTGWLAYKPSICLWSALTRYCPKIIVSLHVVWIAAWLSSPIMKAAPLSSCISLAPIVAPASSASNTVCSSYVPRYSLTACFPHHACIVPLQLLHVHLCTSHL